MVDHHTEAAITIAQQEERIASLERREAARAENVRRAWEKVEMARQGYENAVRELREAMG